MMYEVVNYKTCRIFLFSRTPSTFEKKRTELEKAVARCREEFAPYKEAAKTYANNTVDFTVKATDATIGKFKD